MKIFFDVDGVLIEGWHAKPQRRRSWYTEMQADLGIDPEAFHRGFFETPADGFASHMHGCAAGVHDLKEKLTAFLPTLGYMGPAERIARYWFERDSKLNRAVFAAIERLRRHKHVELYLATGQEHHRAAYLWNELGFKNYFRDIFYCAQLGELKTSPAFFEKINRALSISDDEIPIFFDDTPEIVALARSVGWDAHVLDSADDILNHPRLKDLMG